MFNTCVTANTSVGSSSDPLQGASLLYCAYAPAGPALTLFWTITARSPKRDEQ